MKINKSSIDKIGEEPQDGAFISERLRNPAGDMANSSSSGNDMLYGIFAVIATVAMIVVTVVLYLNWNALEQTGLF